jgi:hypothetical protein
VPARRQWRRTRRSRRAICGAGRHSSGCRGAAWTPSRYRRAGEVEAAVQRLAALDWPYVLAPRGIAGIAEGSLDLRPLEPFDNAYRYYRRLASCVESQFSEKGLLKLLWAFARVAEGRVVETPDIVTREPLANFIFWNESTKTRLAVEM